MSVVINSPKSPVTKGSNGIAAATIPNVCKMPGPPAPFVPVPLPNIGRSSLSPKGYSKKVKIEKKPVAIKGATFASQGDVASKGTGGGLISANTHGPTKFVGPGALDVKIEGKNVQLLTDPMLNNCGPSGNPPNSATLMGVIQKGGMVVAVRKGQCPVCGENHTALGEKKRNDTKGPAQTLVDKYVSPANHGQGSRRIGTMMGVAACICRKKYADKSGATNERFANAAKGAGMTAWFKPGAGQTTNSLAQAAEKAAGPNWNPGAFSKALAEADRRYADRDGEFEGVSVNPPGNCAAQGAMLLLIDDGALADAMTEQWYGVTAGSAMGKAVVFIDRTKKKSNLKRTQKTFKHGDSVPPCRNCELILPFLMCTGGKKTCEHAGHTGAR